MKIKLDEKIKTKVNECFMKAVYSYYFPEVREIVDAVNKDYPHEIFLTSSPIVLDDFHEPIIQKMLNYYSETVPELNKFSFIYPTSGSSEGIREYLSLLAFKGIKEIYVLDGEYEGFRETAKTRGIATKEMTIDDLLKAEPGQVLISNPSARDGNIIPNETITQICDAGHKVFYDLAYLGSTPQNEFDLSHPNIVAGCVSLSKPLGLFRYRIGFTFGVEEIPSLYANKWFKSIPGLLLAEKVFDTLDVQQLYNKYNSWQSEIIDEVEHEFGLRLEPSDAILLATLSENKAQELSLDMQQAIAPFKRGDGYRFCLTPYFEKLEKEKLEVR
jgi:histidinol-phosphate/aromatic aminotransferase/cobyric acid decarboxylase-like protein